jgi:hypothetical protein
MFKLLPRPTEEMCSHYYVCLSAVFTQNNSLQQLSLSSPVLQKQQREVYRSRWPKVQTICSNSLSWEMNICYGNGLEQKTVHVTFISWHYSTRLYLPDCKTVKVTVFCDVTTCSLKHGYLLLPTAGRAADYSKMLLAKSWYQTRRHAPENAQLSCLLA